MRIAPVGICVMVKMIVSQELALLAVLVHLSWWLMGALLVHGVICYRDFCIW